MKLRELYYDMERYLKEDCYCPGEIYDVTGFFFKVYEGDDECAVIESNKNITVCVADLDRDDPQAIIFWHDGPDGRILAAQRVDATDNNIDILRTIAQGVKPEGRKLDEFKPGSTRKCLDEVLSMSDAIMVD